MNEKNPSSAISPSSDTVRLNFKYIKSNFFRVVHANGIMGGVSGRGEINMGFYSERPEFPDSSIILMSQEGKFGPEEMQGTGRHVREIEVDAVLDLITARQVHDWLGNQIKTLEGLIETSRKEALGHATATKIPQA